MRLPKPHQRAEPTEPQVWFPSKEGTANLASRGGQEGLYILSRTERPRPLLRSFPCGAHKHDTIWPP